MLNSRISGMRELNVFANIFDNYWFVIIVLAELNVQIAITSYPSLCQIFNTTPITFGMHMTALGCATGSLVVGYLLNLSRKTSN